MSVSLYDLLPGIIRLRDSEASGANPHLRRVVDATVQGEFNLAKAYLAGLSELYDFQLARPLFLALLAKTLGLSLSLDEVLSDKGEYASDIVDSFQIKGTVLSIVRECRHRGRASGAKLLELYKSTENAVDEYAVTQSDEFNIPAARVLWVDNQYDDDLVCDSSCESSCVSACQTRDELGEGPVTSDQIPYSEANALRKELDSIFPVHVLVPVLVRHADGVDTVPLVTDRIRGSSVVGIFNDVVPPMEDDLQVLITCTAACQMGCQEACEVLCEDSCQTTCETACQAACEGDCQATCQSFCQESCETGCQDSCQSFCQDACESACTGACESSCQQTCQSGCQSSDEGCVSFCEINCQTDAETGCKDSCQLICQSPAQLPCDCQSGCETSCQGSSCQATCEADCQTSFEYACATACEGACTAASCQLTCTSSFETPAEEKCTSVLLLRPVGNVNTQWTEWSAERIKDEVLAPNAGDGISASSGGVLTAQIWHFGSPAGSDNTEIKSASFNILCKVLGDARSLRLKLFIDNNTEVYNDIIAGNVDFSWVKIGIEAGWTIAQIKSNKLRMSVEETAVSLPGGSGILVDVAYWQMCLQVHDEGTILRPVRSVNSVWPQRDAIAISDAIYNPAKGDESYCASGGATEEQIWDCNPGIGDDSVTVAYVNILCKYMESGGKTVRVYLYNGNTRIEASTVMSFVNESATGSWYTVFIGGDDLTGMTRKDFRRVGVADSDGSQIAIDALYVELA